MAKVKKIFPVLQMGCAACAARVENAVKETPGRRVRGGELRFG